MCDCGWMVTAVGVTSAQRDGSSPLNSLKKNARVNSRPRGTAGSVKNVSFVGRNVAFGFPSFFSYLPTLAAGKTLRPNGKSRTSCCRQKIHHGERASCYPVLMVTRMKMLFSSSSQLGLKTSFSSVTGCQHVPVLRSL